MKRLDFVIHGEKGPWLVLLHGFTLTHAMWQQQLSSLKDSFRIIALDLPGHGKSALLPQENTMDQVCSRARSTILDLTGGESFALCGLSLGGYVAIGVAGAVPELVTKLVLINAEVREDTANERERRKKAIAAIGRGETGEFIDSVLPRLFATKRSSKLYDQVSRQMLRTPPATLVAGLKWMLSREDGFSAVTRLATPPVFVRGADDKMYAQKDFQELCDRLPLAMFCQIPNSGHLVCLEQPELLNDCLRCVLR